MLPSIVERDLEEGLRSFIEREFPIATRGFRRSGRTVIEDYMADKTNFMKGPWAEIRRPFRTAKVDLAEILPELCGKAHVAENMRPYAHQLKAFGRLAAARGRTPKSTLIATGTGSGKTECFLLPILDRVLESAAAGRRGIKAIIIYPMNALAADQAKRIAKLCHEIKCSTGIQLTAGLYVGAPGVDSAVMTESACITSRDMLRKAPPDILLTNYKMLDFLLLRAEDKPLWQGAVENLQYLVVDELHTFDGAQGTDLACLIRRLRDYLMAGDDLACVGTSATLGGSSGMEDLKSYASDVFSADFSDQESIITEDRLSPSEYLQQFEDRPYIATWPNRSRAQKFFLALQSDRDFSIERWGSDAIYCWFNRPMRLGAPGTPTWESAQIWLGKSLPYLEAFEKLMREDDGVLDLEEMAARWRSSIEALKDFNDFEVLQLLRALIALVSLARVEQPAADGASKRLVPFLSVRLQLWLKELTTMLVRVSDKPEMVALPDWDQNSGAALPLISCRNCNSAAWGLVEEDGAVKSPSAFYSAWFTHQPEAGLMYPVLKDEYELINKRAKGELYHVCPASGALLVINPSKSVDEVYAKCPICGGDHPPVVVHRPNMRETSHTSAGTVVRRSDRCPHCGTFDSLRIFGARTPTLASALVGHLNSSAANDDHKLIAFSDSVQDAAHRAGFIEARSWSYAMRQAVAGYVRDPDNLGYSLFDLITANGLSSYWKQRLGRELEQAAAADPWIAKHADDIASARFTATFAPTDMQWRNAWLHFRADAVKAAAALNPCSSAEERFGFIPPQKENDQLTEWGRFSQDVDARLRWEAFVELTLRARSGRTLEVSGIAALTPDTGLVDEAAKKFRQLAAQCVDHADQLSPKACRHFVLGFLMHQKSRGAFDLTKVPGFLDFSNFMRSANSYLFRNSWVMPAYGPTSRPPAPLVMRALPGDDNHFFDAVLPSRSTAENWYSLWLSAAFPEELLALRPEMEKVYECLFQALKEADGLSVIPMSAGRSADTPVYMLKPSRWRIATELKRAVCPACGEEHMIGIDPYGDDLEALWETMPCLSGQCGTGQNAGDAPRQRISDVSTPAVLYRGSPVKTTAREHTGNLDHMDRGVIEASFINGREPWDVNLLSATPTLEMGIDIGDLSTVLLAFMPPKEANYIQRIGRAGRRDGNALALAICGAGPHDQYFWTDPEKMLAGDVTPPGVFLHAMAVIERQLFAFGISRWLLKNPKAEIPEKIGSVLSNLEKAAEAPKGAAPDLERFPQGLLAFMRENADALVRDFSAAFTKRSESSVPLDLLDEHILEAPDAQSTLFTDAEVERLKRFIDGSPIEGESSLADRINLKLSGLLAQRKEYESKKSEYAKALRRREKDPVDEAQKKDIQELQESILALSDLISDQFAEKMTLNVLTDEGLLPNYAFPEEGVTLEGVVMRLRQRSSSGALGAQSAADAAKKTPARGIYKRLTFQRAASSGLYELSPENSFYANNFVLHVDQVDLMNDRATDWRFCPNCQHAAPELSGQKSSACPRCGSPLWGDLQQKRKVLAMKTVYAWADIKKDRIADQRDDRESMPQERLLLADVPNDGRSLSAVVPNTGAFGFEYLPKINLKDFNFGAKRRSAADPRSLSVAGHHVQAPGFTVCAGCGRVKQTKTKRDSDHARPQHDYHCKYRSKPDQAEWLEGLFLSSVFTSEAVRIRIPSGTLAGGFDPSVVAASLTAAVKLGLKTYFHGAIDHLRAIQSSFPNAPGESSTSVPTILLYDIVPGGTGYLKELAPNPTLKPNEQPMVKLLTMARDALSSCPCNEDPEADGCYRCVYDHRDASIRSQISRSCALNVLNGILAESEHLEMKPIIGPGRGGGDGDGDDGDSELEARFLNSFAREASRAPAGAEAPKLVQSFTRIPVVDGRDRAAVVMQSGRAWMIDLQVDRSGPAPSRPDFVIRPFRESERAPELEMNIFTDGWTYHAGIVSEDCEKRQSLLSQGQRVWTLVWDDVADSFERHEAPVLASPPNEQIRGMFEKWRQATEVKTKQSIPTAGLLYETMLRGRSNFERLLLWMNDPQAFEGDARSLGVLMMTAGLLSDFADTKRPKLVPMLAPETNALADWLDASSSKRKRQFAELDRRSVSSEGFWKMLMPFNPAVRAALFADAKAFEGMKGEPHSSPAAQALRSFWSAANLLQFLEGGVMLLPKLDLAEAAECLRFSAWMKTADRALLSSIGSAGAPQSSSASANDAEEAGSAVDSKLHEAWLDLLELLPPDAEALVAELERRHVRLAQAGVDYAAPDGVILGTLDLYWPDDQAAVVFAGFTDFPEAFDRSNVPLKVVRLEEGFDAAEAARTIAETLQNAGKN